MSTVLVRLRPHDPKRGHVCRSFTIYSMRFKEKNGWYEVEQEVADFLRPLRQPPSGDRLPDEAPSLFEIRSSIEAVEQEEDERRKLEQRAKAVHPHKMETSHAATTVVAEQAVSKDAEPETPTQKPTARRERAR